MAKLIPVPPGIGSRPALQPVPLPEPEIMTITAADRPPMVAHVRHSDGRYVRKGDTPRNPQQVTQARREKFRKSLRKLLMEAGGVDRLALAIYQGVLEGDKELIKLATEHLYGKPAQQVDVTTQGESLNDRPAQVVHFGATAITFK